MSNDNATLTACREALAAMEQAEAAMPAPRWLDEFTPCCIAWGQRLRFCFMEECEAIPARSDKERWHNYDAGDYVILTEAKYLAMNAEIIAARRNAAPGTLRCWRTLLDMCEAAMLSETDYGKYIKSLQPPNGPGDYADPVDAAFALARHDFALAMLAALADAMGVKE